MLSQPQWSLSKQNTSHKIRVGGKNTLNDLQDRNQGPDFLAVSEACIRLYSDLLQTSKSGRISDRSQQRRH